MAATEERLVATNDVGILRLAATDGARRRIGAYDADSGMPMVLSAPDGLVDTPRTWIPRYAYGYTPPLYGDDACEQPVIWPQGPPPSTLRH